ncbi:triose-phosphate isomerase [bacterium]|nr:triose-phosphate isomerase [bacterium]
MKIIAGNWKMNGTPAALRDMMAALDNVDTENVMIICPPFPMLCTCGATHRAALGAQDVSAHDHGAYTGDVSAAMIADTGAKYVIVGHSERRQYHGETNDVVRAKAAAAIAAGLTPIICVGETMAERDAGQTMTIIESGVRECVPDGGAVIIAYEPRWAIGAGLTPTRDEIAAAHDLIARTLDTMGIGTTPILYGASVKGNNAAEIMSIPHVDGVLVGGASLKPDDFIPIITSVK